MSQQAIFFFSALFFICGCTHKTQRPVLKTADPAFIDSVISNSDSNYTKPYMRNDFVTAQYYVSKEDSAVTQIMYDSAKRIRQIVISKKDVRTYFAQYFSNGQLQAAVHFDSFGQFSDSATYYYENGAVKSSGKYLNGLSTGEWREFDEKGNVTAVLQYDRNGNRTN